MRILIFFTACGWIIFMINIIPSRKNFLSYVGMNTMPVYVFHLTLRYVIEYYGIYIGFISCLVTAWFAVLSLFHKKMRNEIYVTVNVLSVAAFYFIYASGCLAPLYGLVPENIYLLYILVYSGALICGISFVSPFWVKLYNILVNGPAGGCS